MPTSACCAKLRQEAKMLAQAKLAPQDNAVIFVFALKDCRKSRENKTCIYNMLD